MYPGLYRSLAYSTEGDPQGPFYIYVKNTTNIDKAFFIGTDSTVHSDVNTGVSNSNTPVMLRAGETKRIGGYIYYYLTGNPVDYRGWIGFFTQSGGQSYICGLEMNAKESPGTYIWNKAEWRWSNPWHGTGSLATGTSPTSGNCAVVSGCTVTSNDCTLKIF